MADTATLSDKFQISIPKAIRQAQGYTAGQKFAFIPADTGLLLVPIPSASDLRGILVDANPNDYRDRNDRF